MAHSEGNESLETPKAAATPVVSDGKAVPDTAKPEWAMSRREAENARRLREGKKPKRRILPWVLLGVAVIGIGAYVINQQMEAQRVAAEAAANPPPAPEVPRKLINSAESTVVAPRLLQRQVRVTGALNPVSSVTFSAEASGVVESVAVRVGDRVRAGDVLVQVNVEALTLQLNLARSNAEATRVQLGLAESQLARVTELVGRGASTSSALDESRTNVEATRASLSAMQDQIRSAELNLSKATLTAPFDGIVATREAEPGAFVSVGTPLLTLVDMSRMEMLANAAVVDSVELAPDQQVAVTVDGITGRTFEGEVERISPVATTGSRTIPVSIMIDNTDGTLRGGMFGIGQVVTQEAPDAIAIPAAAIRTDSGTSFVLVVVNDTVERRDITTGPRWAGELVQVTEGLAAGDRVITLPLSNLAVGDLVTIAEG
ncbi:efflux RND transporter periplasmic adaptor subunit [Ketogulonicigenium vulgare]|uniref:efflux RND transporter periplasmic adaptor subunit n=1 Tax=Ketogulonicigenium vulgare TaxID=92945 RepID=UPI0001E67EF4|nr:efflux RND transporter periplasmic adaptor subunit [Ketogulonicigenium vulgare]ADO42832.1 NolF secretion protein [Ketogulonicigenium vulgare Y25]ALJ81169.1 RND transporter [Ketogulonicigenium vulgare]ANW33914.1 efflux transporter periplasmic adaptor subunit [Ketogulonicigenium vulgare]AOZ54745.1 NolF secretion protein [Ketogulonicigenium vulgare]